MCLKGCETDDLVSQHKKPRPHGTALEKSVVFRCVSGQVLALGSHKVPLRVDNAAVANQHRVPGKKDSDV